MLGMAAKRGELPYLVLYNLQSCVGLMMFTLANSSMDTLFQESVLQLTPKRAVLRSHRWQLWDP